ncbi:guanine nucleotide-binding protein subunit alpha-11-like [Sycon ciliatum]|uniref:guanine nucleotide-binding protein subunit alpha-11-like n=1 Tax=Sycon ciliatum TaxID=27933 RepID=UPI0020AD44E3|eukprot:scpid53521/ scgid20768/ Guanine nucleotide-binding protein G(q) subunit alpha; Guanine nucleotide-binding protein alpha-q
MPCSCLKPAGEEDLEVLNAHRRIEKDIVADSKLIKTQIKLLLLGAGSSGKSTFVRQMRIIHGNGFSDEERRFIRVIIYDNVVTCMQTLIAAMTQLNIVFEKEYSKQCAGYVANIKAERFAHADEFVGVSEWIQELWKDGGIQVCYSRRSEFEIMDCCSYFLDNVHRLADGSYVPTDMDVVHMRSPTTSVLEYDFLLDDLTYKIVDVGGQETERRKWLSCFEGVTSVIFLAALSEYTHVYADEDGKKYNALMESQQLMAKVMRSKYLSTASFILFLNKNDVFEERIRNYKLREYYPDYAGPSRNADAAYKYIERMFMMGVPMEREQLQQKRNQSAKILAEEPLVYCHRTTATDTENIRRIFSAVKDTILEHFLTAFRMM